MNVQVSDDYKLMKNSDVTNDLIKQGYTLLSGSDKASSDWNSILKDNPEALSSFLQSWNYLPADNFLSDGGHYRFRRYSVFNWLSNSDLALLPHEPHYQSTYRNNMNGGIHREFEAFKDATIQNPLLAKIIGFVAKQISFNAEKQWRIQAHQFRIVANADEAGLPTPEGIHRDGADFILIMLVQRKNIRGGVSHIYDDKKRLVFGGIIENTGDAVLVDDRKVWHGVSEVYPIDNDEPAYRDVLVLTFHNQVTE